MYVEDLYQVALLDMYEHINNYDYNKGRFSTWATWRIRNLAPRWLDRQKEIYVPLRSRFARPEYSSEQIDYSDPVNDEQIGWLTPQVMVSVRGIITQLSDREQLVYRLLCRGFNNVEIGRKIKLTKERVRQVILTLMKRIKKSCQESKELSSLLYRVD